MIRMKVHGTKHLLNEYRSRGKKAEGTAVEVGYTANYALYVHEMVGANFQRPGAKAKFLEVPLRTIKHRDTIMAAMRKGTTFKQALLIAGLALQRASQEIVPVDTSNLRASAYTREV